MNLNEIFPIKLTEKEQDELIGSINKDLADTIFNILRLNGYTPIDINYGDTYFVFQGIPNSVITFHIKEVWNNWKFGIWLFSEYLFTSNSETNDSKIVIQFFCQHEHCIDKFKPSRSGLLTEATARDVKSWINSPKTDFDPWFTFDIKTLVKHIQQHPILAYAADDCDDYIIGHPLKDFIENEIYEYRKKFNGVVKGNIFGLSVIAK